MVTYGIKKEVHGTFEEILNKVKHLLAKEGFGILTEINVTDTLKKKLHKDYEPYVIIGACHPQSAYSALQQEPEIGLLLPCNVIVYQTRRNITVAAIRPTRAMHIVKNPDIASIAQEIEQKLHRVIDTL